MVNKFLFPNGGSETYIFKIGEWLSGNGHEVEYFGMEHEGRIVGNRVNAYTSDMDFHGGSILSKLSYPVKTIYSKEARVKIREVLDDFRPDVCHLNNFNYQLTPSIILEIVKWRKEVNKKCRIIYTAHDLQLVCPMHLMRNPLTGALCDKCLGGHFINCAKGKCIHGSLAKSIIGTAEAYYWNKRDVYSYIDTIISPSEFLSNKLGTNSVLRERTVVLRNFVDRCQSNKKYDKKDYVLYFGRYCYEKGIGTLLEAVDRLKDIQFVFAGSGPLEDEVNKRKNIRNLGFLSGEELIETISSAKFSVVPSECYENCPFALMESQIYGTPVLGADIGGIPELIEKGVNGELFESGNVDDLVNKINDMYFGSYSMEDVNYDTLNSYCLRLMRIYEG